MQYKYHIWLMLAMAVWTVSCQNDNSLPEPLPEDSQKAISFNSEIPEQFVTRANSGLFNIQKSMKLYGTKTVSGDATPKVVFPNYRIQYIDDTKTWEYEADKDASLAGQIVKYWDHDAASYRFIAGAPYDHTSISADGNTVTISDLKMEAGTASSYISTPYLFSEPKTVPNADFDNTVMLNFRMAVCRVKVAFIFKKAQEGAEGEIVLTNIDFQPGTSTSPASYATEGTVAVDYSSASPYTVTPTATSTDALDFANITITYPGNVTPVYAEEIYYMIPLSSSATASPWTLTVGSLTQDNTAVVPAEHMKWEPGHGYVYIFQLSDPYTDPSIKFIQCVNTAINDWTDATGQDATLYNW